MPSSGGGGDRLAETCSTLRRTSSSAASSRIMAFDQNKTCSSSQASFCQSACLQSCQLLIESCSEDYKLLFPACTDSAGIQRYRSPGEGELHAETANNLGRSSGC